MNNISRLQSDLIPSGGVYSSLLIGLIWHFTDVCRTDLREIFPDVTTYISMLLVLLVLNDAAQNGLSALQNF